MNCTIEEKLNEKAYEATTPFCYSCYRDCSDGVCTSCGNDDLMRHLPGVGVEYGVDWVHEHLLDEIEAVDADSIFEEMIEEFYGDTVKIGFIKLATAKVIRDNAPLDWRMARDEHIDSLIDEETLVDIDGKYYWASDIESRL